MSTREDAKQHRHTSSNARPPSVASSLAPQNTPFTHVPRFALVHDIAAGTRTYAPVTYLFNDEPHPAFTNEGKQRSILVDLTEEGDRVVHAQSLSAEWQLVTAKISTSARIANVEGGETSPGNTVLNIEGMGQFKPYSKSDDVFELARQFTERYLLSLFADTRNDMIRRLIEKSQEMMKTSTP
jgi:hypothetical protein